MELTFSVLIRFLEIDRISGQKAAHEKGKLGPVAAQQEVEMIVEQSSGETVGAGFLKKGRESLCEHRAVVIVEKDFPSLDPAHDDMLQ